MFKNNKQIQLKMVSETVCNSNAMKRHIRIQDVLEIWKFYRAFWPIKKNGIQLNINILKSILQTKMWLRLKSKSKSKETLF